MCEGSSISKLKRPGGGGQVGKVVFQDFRVADCGAGPDDSASTVNGKDHGGGIEFTWVVGETDQRRTPYSRAASVMDDMAGVEGALVVARTTEGDVGTAGAWNSRREIRGIITQVRLLLPAMMLQPEAHPSCCLHLTALLRYDFCI